MKGTWIWLPEAVYPDNQFTKFDALSDNSNDTYTVAEFQKTYSFDKPISSVRVRFSADTELQLFCNDVGVFIAFIFAEFYNFFAVCNVSCYILVE